MRAFERPFEFLLCRACVRSWFFMLCVCAWLRLRLDHMNAMHQAVQSLEKYRRAVSKTVSAICLLYRTRNMYSGVQWDSIHRIYQYSSCPDVCDACCSVLHVCVAV